MSLSNPPRFIDDDNYNPRPAFNDFRGKRIIGAFFVCFLLMSFLIVWLTSGAGEAPPPKPLPDQNIADGKPLPGLATDYTQIQRDPVIVPPPPLPEPVKDEPKPEIPSNPTPEAPRQVIVQQGGGGSGRPSWRQEARDAETKLVTVNQRSQGSASSGQAVAGGQTGGSVRGAMYSQHKFTSPFPKQINQGTPMRAHTDVPMFSGAEGYVTARVIGDIWTADRECVAIPDQSVLFGQNIGEVKDGQSRINIAWTSLTRPQPRGDSIELVNVRGADKNGMPGISGEVNRHWLRKIGAVAAATVIDLGTAALQGRSGGGFAVVLGDSVSNNARSPLDEFARKQIDIPDTIEVEPKEISVMLSQHIPVDCFKQ